MQEILIDNIIDLTKQLNSIGNSYIFRGQSNSEWHLTSSLERLLGDGFSADRITKHEEFAFAMFKSKFELYNHEVFLPKSRFSILAAMQHYGVPTRLIDFSESPYVALHFAIEGSSPNTLDDFSVWAIDYREINNIFRNGYSIDPSMSPMEFYLQSDRIFSRTIEKKQLDVLWVGEPHLVNCRLDRQGGTFLLSCNKGKTVEEILGSPPYSRVEDRKSVV